jgi:hypothetical protein
MSIEIGAVKAIVGKFWIENPNGETHLAVIGEMIHEGDRIIGSSANTANSTLSLDLAGNTTKDIVLGVNDVLMLDQTFLKDALSMEDARVSKASLVAAWDGPSEELSIKIEDNKDALAVADTEKGDGKTAAGGAASDGQITPAYFADRTGAFGDVRTALSLTTPDTTPSDAIAPLTSPIVLEPELVNNPPVLVDFREGPGEPIEGYSFNYSENSVAGVIIGTVHATD